MIVGIGHDLIENLRIRRIFDEYGQQFLNKILSSAEQEIFALRNNKIAYLAKRFAAKEAFAKACGSGIRTPILMPNISIINNNLGKPQFVFTDSITNWLNQRLITSCHLSLTDEVHLSSAFVILESQ